MSPRTASLLAGCLLASSLSTAAAQAHPEYFLGVDGSGKLVVKFDATRPHPMPASRFPGIDGYADVLPGVSTLLEAKPADDFFPPDPTSKLEFALLGADDGMTVWNDRGTGTMQPGQTFNFGHPPFDSHPIWNIVKGEPGKTYALRLVFRDTTGRHADSDVFEPRFAPDDSVELYACPMACRGGAYAPAPGRCAECGMALKLFLGRRYRVSVEPELPVGASGEPEPLRAGVEATLRFRIQTPDGTTVKDLEVVHEKLLHLLMVSSDLAWFAHEHPEIQPDGTFLLRFAFPHGGTFTLYHDFTPPKVGMQVVPVNVEVAGEAPAQIPLTVGASSVAQVDGYGFALDTGGPLKSLLMQQLAVRISQGETPVTDLEPFLGAMGHLIVISRDRKHFVHSHPSERATDASGKPVSLSGPVVRFGAQFPAPGTYKAWAQFQHRGRVLTAPFVFDVRAP